MFNWNFMLVVGAVALVMNLCTGHANNAAGDRVKVIDLPGVLAPDAEIDSSGIIHVAYLSNNDIFYLSSADGGDSFSIPMRVNSEQGFAAGGLFRGPDLALGKDERVHIGWYNNANAQRRPKHEWGFMYARMNKEKTAFEPSRNLNGRPSDGYSLAADSSGNLGVVWVDNGLFLRFSDDGGESFDPPVEIAADPCECCGTRALYSTGGHFNYLYRDKENDDRDMYVGRFGPANDAVFPVKLNAETWHIEACPLSGNHLTQQGEQILAAWESKDGVYYARLNQQGGILPPGDVKVSANGKFPVVLGGGDETLVAWKQGAVLKWRIFDAEGGQGGVRRFNSAKNGRRPAGVVLQDGRFLLFP